GRGIGDCKVAALVGSLGWGAGRFWAWWGAGVPWERSRTCGSKVLGLLLLLILMFFLFPVPYSLFPVPWCTAQMQPFQHDDCLTGPIACGNANGRRLMESVGQDQPHINAVFTRGPDIKCRHAVLVGILAFADRRNLHFLYFCRAILHDGMGNGQSIFTLRANGQPAFLPIVR